MYKISFDTTKRLVVDAKLYFALFIVKNRLRYTNKFAAV